MSLDPIYAGHWLHSTDSDTTTGIVRSSVTRIMRMEREYFVVRIGIQLLVLDFHFFLSWPSLLLLSVFYDINQQNQSLWYCHYSVQSISSSSYDQWLFVFSPQGMSRDCLRSRDPGRVIPLSLDTLPSPRPASPDFATLLVTTHQRHRDVDTIWHPQQHANTTQPHETANL